VSKQVSSSLRNISTRSAKSLHGVLIDLRDEKPEELRIEFHTLPLIADLYNNNQDEEIFETFSRFALEGSIQDSNDLYLLIRSYLRTKRVDEAIEVMTSNLDAVFSNRNIIYEYIILLGKLGNYSKMNHAVSVLKERYGTNGVHSKVLQALLISRAPPDEIEDYISSMKMRYEENAPYEITRAGINSKSLELALEYAEQMQDTPRNNYMALRTYFRTGNKNKARIIIDKMKPPKYSEQQIMEVIRIGLQLDNHVAMKNWFKHSKLNQFEIEIELARSQFKNALSESDFDSSFSAFKKLYKVDTYTPHEVLLLLRTNLNEIDNALLQLLEFGQADPFLLSCVAELATKYNQKTIADEAFERLEAMSLCADRHSDIFIHYLRAAWDSANLNYLTSVYRTLPNQHFRGNEIHDFAKTYNQIMNSLGIMSETKMSTGGELLEGQLLSKLLLDNISENKYDAIKNHAVVVNNSLKFGGAERQVVRCLSSDEFSKSLVVWNSRVNTSNNSFIDEVNSLELKIHDYSLPLTPSPMVFTPEIEKLLSLIPNTSPLNPGITNKIRNLTAILLKERPYSLHLWQDTTNVLGAIAGLIAGVPRIMMSARSLPPFAIKNSSFPNKGPNYYLNNRYVRILYQQLLKHDNVYLCHNSENGMQKYIEWLGGFEEKMQLLRNGFDFSDFASIVPTKKEKSDVPILGSVFRFVDVKRPFLWLDVAKQLLGRMNGKIKFRLVGDGPMLGASIAYANELGINESVEFLGYRDDVKELLLTFDAFLLTSTIEGLPNVLIEAQAMGVPVISTDAGGARETFVNGLSGRLVDSSEIDSITGAVLEVLNDDKYGESASKMGQEFVFSRYSIAVMHKQLHHILFGDLR
jgi:glycosyltransferase involved in cell wall biosynthesis